MGEWELEIMGEAIVLPDSLDAARMCSWASSVQLGEPGPGPHARGSQKAKHSAAAGSQTSRDVASAFRSARMPFEPSASPTPPARSVPQSFPWTEWCACCYSGTMKRPLISSASTASACLMGKREQGAGWASPMHTGSLKGWAVPAVPCLTPAQLKHSHCSFVSPFSRVLGFRSRKAELVLLHGWKSPRLSISQACSSFPQR